jgi:hypothetical protein
MEYQALIRDFFAAGNNVTYCKAAKYRRNSKYRRTLKTRPVAFYKGLV